MNIRILPSIALGLLATSLSSANPTELALERMLSDNPALRTHTNQDGRIDRLYGTIFSQGHSPQESAQNFLTQHAGIWGVSEAELAPIGRFADGRHLQPIMPERNEQGEMVGYRFTGVYYTQQAGPYPVWNTSLCLLVRNSEQHELVLAASDLRAVNGFVPEVLPPQAATIDRVAAVAKDLMGPAAVVENAPEVVVFAGAGDQSAPPQVALVFEARVGTNRDGNAYRRVKYVINAEDGTLLHEENRVLNCGIGNQLLPLASATAGLATGGLTGAIEANAGDGWSAEECDPEAQLGLPYASLLVDGVEIFADANGQFNVDGDIGDNVTLSSQIRGLYFVVNNQQGGDSLVEANVNDGDEVTIVHNEDATEFTFAEVDTYIAANEVRELILDSNPDFPTIATETGWPINVNLADTCNAYYDYSSINFFASGGSCNNTGFGTIAHHEYGHHMIACAGSGQGEYGEGYSDCLALVMTLDPVLARGFFIGNCVSGIRNADNACQYLTSGCSSCGSAIHACGQLISGCVYDTWEALMVSSPFTGTQLIRDLTINAVLVHTGTSINPAITIDFLTLNDDDGDLSNGSPHYEEIALGFGLHDMDAPQLAYLSLSLPDGIPTYVDPDGGTEIRVRIEESLGTYAPGTAKMYVGVDNIYDIIPLIDEGNGDFTGVFSESNCGEGVDFWFSAQTTSGELQRYPDGAPDNQFATLSAQSEPTVAFQDDCTTDPGWTVAGDATDGLWERGIPAGGNNRPVTDCDSAASFCWLTENTAAGGGDVDGGETLLISPRIDATGVGSVSYCYWYRNIGGGQNVEDDVFRVHVSDDDGATWTQILSVGPTGPGTEGDWRTEETFFADLPDFQVNDQFRIRFNASDLNQTSRVEAAIDNIVMVSIDCEPDEPGCDGDVNGDNVVDVNDILLMLNDWGNCSGCPSDTNDDGVVDVNDILALLANYGDC
ncbi:MAG: hypothetical protein MK116_02200 [Phycisphaerales bacterium]|nr:hypothetical protein [Phycisphaerales bacterium]